jgi:NAD(P)-dependent dehydrogenase (short-subunit alcohol dehydrogenase family)
VFLSTQSRSRSGREPRFDRLDFNAAAAAPTRFGETTPADLERAFRLAVATAFELTRPATPRLLESDRAAVINISSRMDRLVAGTAHLWNSEGGTQ